MTSTPTVPNVGRRLTAARLRRGLSQGSVARRAGIAPSYLSRIETGKVHPTFRTVLKITNVLKVKPEEIVTAGPGAARWRGVCPVSSGGECLLDLIRQEAQGLPDPGIESYTPRQIRLLRRLAVWMRQVKPDRLRAMEVLLEEMTDKARR